MLTAVCPRCGNVHHADEIHRGKMLRCAKCGDAVQIGSNGGSSRITKAGVIKPANVRASTPGNSSIPYKRSSGFRSKWSALWSGVFVCGVVLVLIGVFVLRSYTGSTHSDIFDDVAANNSSAAVRPLVSSNQEKLHRTLATGTRLRSDSGTYGKGILVIDNGSNSDALVKVINIMNRSVIRYVFVQRFSKINLTNIPQGTYTVRFCFGEDFDREHSAFTRFGSFYAFGKNLTFDEIEKEDHTEYTREEITLHTTPGGNVPRRQIDKYLFDLQ